MLGFRASFLFGKITMKIILHRLERGGMAVKISLCMIVRDEEEVLQRCLDSIAELVDEIIIVDTGSVDKTKSIAEKYTDKIYGFLWEDDFSSARNFAFSKGTGDYLMWMDADDVLPASEKQKFSELRKELEVNPCDVVMMVYDAGFDEEGRVTFSYYRERLVKNCSQAKWVGCVHEVIPPFGKVRHEEIRFAHRKEKRAYSDRNLKIYEKMLGQGKDLEPRARFYYGRELYYHGKYEKASEVFRGFLEGGGWLENKLEAVRFLAYSLQIQGKTEEAFDALLQGLRLAPPTGELCCDMGRYFFERKDWETAVFWYESALKAEKRTEKGAFVQEECYGFLPCIQLCVCYDQLGEGERAKMYNEMAGVFQPKSAAVQHNREYFLEKEKNSSILHETAFL